jgi:hypothetical protein
LVVIEGHCGATCGRSISQQSSSALTFYLPVRTVFGIQAGIRDQEPLDWAISENVRFNDFLNITQGDVSIPDSFGVNHDVRAMLALIETSCLVGAHLTLQSATRQSPLERLVQFTGSGWVARATGIFRRPLVGTNKNVLLELRHKVWRKGQSKRAARGGPVL